MDIKTVSGMLGHFSAGFTLETYAHVTTSAQKEAAQTIGNIVHIGLTQQIGKLLFVALRPKLSVIANQSADWCGNPPVERNQVTITTKNSGESKLSR